MRLRKLSRCFAGKDRGKPLSAPPGPGLQTPEDAFEHFQVVELGQPTPQSLEHEGVFALHRVRGFPFALQASRLVSVRNALRQPGRLRTLGHKPTF